MGLAPKWFHGCKRERLTRSRTRYIERVACVDSCYITADVVVLGS
jgi:hypothetical protein